VTDWTEINIQAYAAVSGSTWSRTRFELFYQEININILCL